MTGGTQSASAVGEGLTDAGRVAAQELIAEYEGDWGRLPAESRRRARQFMLDAGLLEDQPTS